MESWLPSLHAGVGYLVFIAGLVQFVAPKGGKWHRWIGRIYFVSWFVLLISGAILGSLLIAFLGIFGFYFVLSAVRYAQEKKIPRQLFDKVQAILGLLTGIAILISAVIVYQKGHEGFSLVFLVFGVLFSFSSITDIRLVVLQRYPSERSKHRMYWFTEHYGRMVISFIAATTAFSAIQDLTGMVVVNWLWPTVAGSLAIILLNRHYRKKFEPNA